MSRAPTRQLADDGAMDSLLAAVEAAAATNSTTICTFPATSTATMHPTSPEKRHRAFNSSSRDPVIAPLHTTQAKLSTPISGPPPTSSSVPPPPPLPPPLPVPPPLPPMAIRRSLTVPNNTFNTTSIVTVHEASTHPSGSLEKKCKGARIFSADEKKVLEANYGRNKFPSRLHMQTLGRAMGKGTEKVRTWYNNRRALDRKLGIDVSRNFSHPSRSDFPMNPCPISDPNEEPIILPSHAIASPTTLAVASRVCPGQSTSKPAEIECGFGSTGHDMLVNVTPSAITWAPSVSPITVERNPDTATSSPTQMQTCRLRMSPLRIRNGRLLIAESEICGELNENPGADKGLEIKFLFGKKRVVYEWYCGKSFEEAQLTGGPYAKMEMDFSSIANMQLIMGSTGSILQLSFSAAPSLFLQTQESMDKYKVRAQQRQYRKISPEDFPIPVCQDFHQICLGTDDAVRISKILVEDTPKLGSVFKTLRQDDGFNAKPGTPTLSPRLANPTSKAESQLPTTAVRPSLLLPRSCKMSPIADSKLSSVDLPRSAQRQFTKREGQMSPSVPLPVTGQRQSQNNGIEVPIVRSTSAAGAATNLLASPAPWHSPATPFISTSRRRREEDIHWFSSGLPPSVSAMPFVERTNIQDTPTGKVRRELNFNNVNQFAAESTTPTLQPRKRSTGDSAFDENNPRRRKLDSPHTKPPQYESQLESPAVTLPSLEMDKSRVSVPHFAEHADVALSTLPR